MPMLYSVKLLNRFAGIVKNLRLEESEVETPTLQRCQSSRINARDSHGNYYDGLGAGLLPSVAQPPFPLQEFFPLQPLSLVLQPPLPLQEFWPLQACFSFLASDAVDSFPASPDIAGLEPSDAGAAFIRAIVPLSKPLKAAVSTSECLRIAM